MAGGAEASPQQNIIIHLNRNLIILKRMYKTLTNALNTTYKHFIYT